MPRVSRVYLFGCYLGFVLFLAVAFGINGIPYIKRIGVIGFSAMVPFLIGFFLLQLKKENRFSLFFSSLSLFSIIIAMTLALLNEFWLGMPKVVSGISFMTLTHGVINTIFTVPCFYLAIRFMFKNDFAQTTSESHVVFFDGSCALCSKTVTTLIKIDKRRVLRYTPLDGKYAERTLDPRYTKYGASVLFLSRAHLYEKAEAIIHILFVLDGLYKLAAMFLSIFPLFILNRLYTFIADNRYRILGRNVSCLLPTEENKNLFIS